MGAEGIPTMASWPRELALILMCWFKPYSVGLVGWPFTSQYDLVTVLHLIYGNNSDLPYRGGLNITVNTENA